MNNHFKEVLLQSTHAKDLFELDRIQSLWSGYGAIMRYGLKDADMPTVVVKHVSLPKEESHPRGWNTDLSHMRKLKSYAVETFWYKEWSQHCDDDCYVPKCFACESKDDEVLIVLEDLDAVGYAARLSSVSINEIKVCLKWLAYFHGTFMNKSTDNLWAVGTYWHLDTRPDELDVLDDIDLKNGAAAIDKKLNTCSFQTFVHGDAKLANFCFSNDGTKVAAVDFQYVGGGCGMKDVAYFIGSCLHEEDCAEFEVELLDYYFEHLKKSIKTKGKDIDVYALESEWRELYPVAWTDFHRFIKGWSPGHWKINSYSERLAREVLEQL
ncbi:MAG: hypothetical protein ACI9F2_000349 [Lysobacterales bacterium]|jgi:hypothetical protein